MGSRSRRPSEATDPRRLREMHERAVSNLVEHGVTTMVAGLAGAPEDRLLPEFYDFVESELRMEDAVFRMTRERAILYLSDLDAPQAQSVLERLIESFGERFPSRKGPCVSFELHPLAPSSAEASLRDVLIRIFPRD